MEWYFEMDIEPIISGIIWKIKTMFQPELWNIKDERRLAEHIAVNSDLCGDEWIYAARDLISNLNLKMTAREFFFRGHKQSSIFDTSDSKPRSAMESILMIYPDFFESELVRDVVDRAVAMDADYVNSDIYKAAKDW